MALPLDLKEAEAILDYEMDYYDIPYGLRSGIKRYILNGTPCGNFLMGVIRGELYTTFNHGDDSSIAHLGAIVRFFYNVAPMESIKHNADTWMAKRGLKGLIEEYELDKQDPRR